MTHIATTATRLMALMLPIAFAIGRVAHEASDTINERANNVRATSAITEIAPMSVPRAAHSATTLMNGRVLVTGGMSVVNESALAAEMYDARTGRFTALPRMVTLRQSHTATLLANGKVLIVGGYANGGEVTSDAELFDPATNTFARTGSLRGARAGQIAVLLNNGKVLIAGGVGPGWSFLSSAELYDPVTGQFSATGSMTEMRESHVAALLLDGRVLVAGGHRDRRENIKLYTSAEVYDVSSGTFKPVGDMHTRRHKHDGVLLRDGRVLITGGSDERDNKGAYNSTEFFDPKTNSFVNGPEMQVARYKHNGAAIVLSNGQVLIAGGATRAELFDPSTQRFTIVAGDARMAGQFSAVARVGETALITGGYGGGSGPRSSAWVYRP